MKTWELLFAQLAEEAAEVAQEATKCLRFGPTEIYQPIGISNAERVMRELADLAALVQMLQDAGKLPRPSVETQDEMIAQKKSKVRVMLTYSNQVGRADDYIPFEEKSL